MNFDFDTDMMGNRSSENSKSDIQYFNVNQPLSKINNGI